MNSEEIAAAMKEYDEELGVIDKPPAPKQVLATLTNMEGGSSEANRTPPQAEPTNREAPRAPARINNREMPPPVA